jgi:hypothetical protein
VIWNALFWIVVLYLSAGVILTITATFENETDESPTFWEMVWIVVLIILFTPALFLYGLWKRC